MLLFWLGGVVCFIGYVRSTGETIDLEIIAAAAIWPIIIAFGLIFGDGS